MIRHRAGPDTVYAEQPDEVTFVVNDVDGTIPPALSGALLKNGPGRLSAGDDPLSVPDGPGMLSALVLDRGAARFLCRYVRTSLYEEETAAKKMLRRRLFTNRPGRLKNVLDVNVGDPINHDVYPFAGRIFASGNSSHYAIEPSSLKTIGKETFGLSKHALLTPMTKLDPTTNHLVTHATFVKPGRQDAFTFVEIDERLRLVAEASTTLHRSLTFTHDVAFSQRWYAVVENPAALSVPRALSGKGRLWDALQWSADAPAILHLVPRGKDDGRAPRALTLPPEVRTVFHLANAYDDGEDFVIDVCATYGRVDFRSQAPPELRARDDLPLTKTPGGVVLRLRARPSSPACEGSAFGTTAGETPEVNERFHGLRHRCVWLATPESTGDEPDPNMTLWYHGIAKLDVDTKTTKIWSAGPRCYVSQPAFAPRPGATLEDDGYLLVWVTDADAHRTDVVVLDARDPSTGPIARIKLGALFPAANHVRWAAGMLPG